MISFFRYWIAAGVLGASLSVTAQDIVVNVGRPLDTAMPASNPVLEFDFGSYFASFPTPGPVATLHFRVASEGGARDIFTARAFDGVGNPTGFRDPVRMMSYQLGGELEYDNLFQRSDGAPLTADDFGF
ncbi:MAG: hypothetical protein LR015_03775 [Verrucomicrobia bacterium]|nr:hypothetical protein [Verrucomicrobiota bacterium]